MISTWGQKLFSLITSFSLREDSFKCLREDGTFELEE